MMRRAMRPGRGIVGAVRTSDPERDGGLDFVGDGGQAIAHCSERDIGPDGSVAAGDVESDADDRDTVAVGGHAADRHDVAHVAISHQCDPVGAGRDVLKLLDGFLVVLTEDVHSRKVNGRY